MTETGYAAAQPIALPFDTPAPDGTDALIGHTPVFCRTREQIERIAALDAPVALTGEPGSGKTRLARAIHAGSDRVAGPFVTVSCRALPETPLEIDLFGCVKGAVVGASADRHGLLDTAHGGTVVLEDVDELSLHTQGLLLRFLETGEVRALGTLGAGTPSDVRILATSRVPLAGRVAAGTFRDDLRAALTQHAIAVPALRDRRPDVPVLVDYFARATASRLARPAASFTPEAHRALMAYSWPGNVGELRRVIERLSRSAEGLDVGPHDLPVGIRPRRAASARRRREPSATVAETLYQWLAASGESFWSVVYPLFMAREITRADLRELVRRGLQSADGDVPTLLRLLNMPASDQRKFLAFLRKYDCHGTL
jgi:DNA-binding NtrC family response regulator